MSELNEQALTADQTAFEAWAKLHGGLNLEKDISNERGDYFPATYWSAQTEIAWRAWANKPAAPAQELSALPELPPLPLTLLRTYSSLTERSHEKFILDYARAYGLLCRQQGGSDAARLDHMEAWNKRNIERGFFWNQWAFSVKSSIREQLDAAIQAQAGEAKGGA